jgi:hypothetical protein
MTRVRLGRLAALILTCTLGLALPLDARAAASPSKGLAVLAEGDATVSAWALARAVYGDVGLLPPGLDEARARALVGETPGADAPRDVRDLAETRLALHGEDAPSRSLLSAMAASLHVKGILVVVLSRPGASSEAPALVQAKVFVADTGTFDAVLYQPDPPPPVTWGSARPSESWASAANALHRAFADVAAPTPAESQGPPLAVSVASVPQKAAPPAEAEKKHPFYTSPWFWGALGAAAFAGAAFYFVTRDASDPSIQLQVQVPK